jgi:hypothetical protein
MELQHLVARLPVEGELKMNPADCVNLFHRWVAGQTMPEMLVDVAELLHVPAGPGVIAVGHEADYALDRTGGNWAILYRRKTPEDGTNADRVARVLASASAAAALIEAEFSGQIAVSRNRFEIVVNDRALAPNRSETFAAAEADLKEGIARFLGHSDFTIAPQGGDARRRFSVIGESKKTFSIGTAA